MSPKDVFVMLAIVIFMNIFILPSHCQNEKPKFRILAPQFICGKPAEENGTSSVPSPPGATKIRLQTKSGQKLRFDWTVRFKVLAGPRGQRFNLLVWRAVRNLEKSLTEMSPEIAETNSVAINNTMLIEGVDYVFNITGINEKGVISDTNTFVIKFTDAKSEPKLHFDDGDSQGNEQFSVLMLGSDVTYADMPYLAVAQVTPCKPTNDYYFSWNVNDIKNAKVVDVRQQMGKKLTILPGTLVAGQSYDITCHVLRIPDSGVITTSGIFITVLSKGMTVELNTEKVTVAVNVPFSISAVLNNPDNVQGALFFDWTCKVSPDLRDCDSFKSPNNTELNMESGFPSEGEYQLEVTVVKGNSKALKKVIVIVQDAMLPTIELGSASRLTVSGEPLEIQAQVSDLRPGCNLKWMPLNGNGIEVLNAKDVPGELGNSMSINSRDETFLSEIVEYGNDTFDRNFPLIIPAANDVWPGLLPNVMYKFRLLVECTCSPSIQCEGPKNVTAYSDIIIETNQAPVPKPVKVTPISGIALQTVFQFSTVAASDLLRDYPLKYTFGYKASSADVYTINSYIENLVTETILPYSEIPLTPTLTVCDSRGGCSEIDGDPVTTVKPIKLTIVEIGYMTDKFEKLLYRKEYFEGFQLARMVSETLMAMNDGEIIELFKIKMEAFTKADIKKQMAQLKSKTFIMSSNDFIKESTKYIEKFPVSDDLLQDILKLRDAVFEVVSGSPSNGKNGLISTPKKTSSMLISRRRSIFRYISSPMNKYYNTNIGVRRKREVSPSDIENFLKMSEYIILNSKDESRIFDEKKKVLSKLQISAPDLCKTTSRISTVIGIERITLKQNFIYQSIPYHPRVGAKLNSTLTADMQINSPEKQLTGSLYCIAKFAFTLNFLESQDDKNRKGLTYYSLILKSSDDSTFHQSEGTEVVLRLPVGNIASNDHQFLQCRRWNDGKWDENTCETNEKYINVKNNLYVICKCDDLGYFSLYITTKPTKPTRPTVEPISSLNQTASLNSSENTDALTTELGIVSSSVTSDTVTYMVSTKEPDNIVTPVEPTKTTIDDIYACNKSDKQLCDAKESIKNQDAETPTWVYYLSGCLIVGILIVTIFILNKKIKNKYNATVDSRVLPDKELISPSPKYRKFYAEHLMDGSAESMAKYIIAGDFYKINN